MSQHQLLPYARLKEFFADLFNHSKGVINEKKGLIFTANIDGFHGLRNGFEVGYILQEKQRIEAEHA